MLGRLLAAGIDDARATRLLLYTKTPAYFASQPTSGVVDTLHRKSFSILTPTAKLLQLFGANNTIISIGTVSCIIVNIITYSSTVVLKYLPCIGPIFRGAGVNQT